ncbi:sulfatase-like hydrolase/transferase [Candidatus Poribacteria bacterium]|nr:sulfatase-like hydrolase/transferase [Candidatus Poribacteria bacterium]MYB00791.1 sulfatase-like hydrolase/transferase [Candidatus Poribacteria bacterium]
MHKQSFVQGRESFSVKRPFTRRSFLTTSLKAGAAAFTTGLLPKRYVHAEGQYNVLFIMVDDLRPRLGCYGHSEMHTPNIDRLAQQGTLFNRAYCQYPVCNPSRTSMLTGLRPQTTRVFNNSTGFREMLPNAVTLPQHFKTAGYHTQSVGKIAHNLSRQDDIYSWSVPSWGLPITNQGPSNPSWQALDVEDDELSSGKTAKRAVEILKEIQNTRFFLAVGFHTPHLPLYAPKKYYELYEGEDFRLPSSSILPSDAPSIAGGKLIGDIRLFRDIPDKGTFSDAKSLELIWAYAASISYMDAQVGRILQQLDALRLTENTVIVFASDHGFHLGEHGKWGKNSLFEVSLHSPLMVRVPGQTHLGTKTDALVELVDIYPTLCDACQLPIPTQLEGTSMIPIIEQPTHPWKTAAFSQVKRGGVKGNSMRTERYRYTEWGQNGSRGTELYDYDTDPDETVNIADLSENTELVKHLSEQLHAGWREALPDISERISVPQTLLWDINNDGIVDIQDLLLVSNSFDVETLEHPKVDVNGDGRVDIIDLLLVAAHFGESNNPAAPSKSMPIPAEHAALVDEWLTEARLVDDGSDIFRQGIATLEHLIHTTVPPETALLPNYPNPFNPETWIPYDLAEDANVHIDIYNLKGESVRWLSIGFQTAGTYRVSSRAAYWDGRNAVGEPVASGIYFYTFQAGRFRATRQMVILK